jgi:hypothetical protein
MSATQSRLSSGRVLASRRGQLNSSPVAPEVHAVDQRHGRPRARPKRDVAGVLLGAAEICLLSKDPHLAMRAAWVLLREDGVVSDADAMGGRAVHR